MTDQGSQIVKIDNIGYGGDGIGKLGSGKTVFVPRTIPGEKHQINITTEKKTYAHGESGKIIKKSNYRDKAKCEIFDRCGGCQWQHISYNKQKKYKELILKDSLTRIGKLNNIKLEPLIGVDNPWFYRNKSTIPLQKDQDNNIISGFYQRGTHQVTNCRVCYIQHQLINRINKYTVDLLNKYDLNIYNESRHKGLLRHLLIRVGVCTNQALLTFITTKEEFPHLDKIANCLMEEIPELKGIVRNINNKRSNVLLGEQAYTVNGQDHIIDYIGIKKFKISYDSFFQVNTIQTKKLYNVVEEFLELNDDKIIVDAYSGIGSIAISIDDNYKKIYGIESNKSAVDDSKCNARINGLKNSTFINGDIKDVLPDLISKKEKPDSIIFDPPRSGLDQSILKTVIKNKIDEIIYVSCNPTTLARDLKRLKDEYDIIKIQPVDMFPHTYHIETVVKLRRE
ncbi:MAG: 23S rRNA (uracil(1939)-C(5))-methyltransferase RlmD [Halanaerobiales bacterium]|nr:23S rRNA (uracil(1939)-C(5))-methyltransferase RlmD [Halanaerobiales bacterium]